jgi:TRAP transporter TAXI family solute receptor
VLGPGKFVYEDFGSIIQVPEDQAAQALVEGRVEVVLLAGPVPSPALQQAAAQRPVRLISINEGWQDLIRRQYPSLIDFVVPAGTYPGQDENASTVGARTILATRLDADEGLIADLAQALVDGFAEIADNSPIARDFAPEDLTHSVRTPFHPGAVQGYLQKGLFK